MFQFAFLFDYAKKNNIDRYFQDPQFFKFVKDDILKIFQEGIPEQSDLVAIHVRRGDYVTTHKDFYVDLMETDYYEKAMAQFSGHRYMVFSDDIEWCKKQEIFKNCLFSHKSELEDMNNMASCVGHIIANSSFSWWGAFISPYTKKVVAPSIKNWYRDGEERTKCPISWIRI